MIKTRVDYAAVARLAREAHALGIAASGHVAHALGTSVKTANVAIHRARLAGHDIPALPHNPKPSAEVIEQRRLTPVLALRCTCGKRYPIERQLDLAKHTWREHRRAPSKAECTPRTSIEKRHR